MDINNQFAHLSVSKIIITGAKELAKGAEDAEVKVRMQLDLLLREKKCLSEEEVWALRAFDGGYPLQLEEYQDLSEKIKTRIFKIGNLWQRFRWVAHLKSYGAELPKKFLSEPFYPSIISDSMDIVEIKRKLTEFIDQLQKEGSLLSREKFDEIHMNKQWLCKSPPIERLQGRIHLLKVIKKLGIESIDVPKKIAVIPADKKSLQFTLHFDAHLYYGERIGDPIVLINNELELYSEVITKSDRKISQKEMKELLSVIEEANFSDIHPANFIVTENKIYIIDTEFKSFQNEIIPAKLRRLEVLLHEQDHIWFSQLVDKMEKSSIEASNIFEQSLDEKRSSGLLTQQRLTREKRRRKVGLDRDNFANRKFIVTLKST